MRGRRRGPSSGIIGHIQVIELQGGRRGPKCGEMVQYIHLLLRSLAAQIIRLVVLATLPPRDRATAHYFPASTSVRTASQPITNGS